jgi:hypothetical protein
MAATCYISEPPSLLKAIWRDLSDYGIPADLIRTDAWE